MNLFGTVLTYTAPSANYRGENAENRAVIQKITKGRFEYPIISPEAMRNALRETLGQLGLPCNRSRMHDEDQPAIEFKDYPNADEFADDFFMGWLIAAGSSDRKKIEKELKGKNRDLDRFSFKRDSVVRMNMAVGLEPYRHNTVFTQSPQDKSDKDAKAHKNTDNAQLLHRETAVTPYQYPFALNLDDCSEKPDWTKTLLQAVGQLNNVAGNHARSYFEFAPASIVLRLTTQLVAGYDSYGFRVADEQHSLPEVVDGILADDFLGDEFFVGGTLVKQMTDDQQTALSGKGVTLDRNPQRLLQTVGKQAFK